MARSWVAGLCLALASVPALGEDFSANSVAQSWGLTSEQKARFEATVVDVLCEVAGDCVENCGGGERLLGLLRSADNVLVLASRNAQQLFTGAVHDLLPFCGQRVVVDGLLIGAPDQIAMPVYEVQIVRPVDQTRWVPATRWTEVWATLYPDAAAQAAATHEFWFRHDPRVQALIARDGYLGLGLDVDAAFIDGMY